jgi:hypothetical protein
VVGLTVRARLRALPAAGLGALILGLLSPGWAPLPAGVGVLAAAVYGAVAGALLGAAAALAPALRRGTS